MEHVTETVEQMYHLYHQDIVHFFAEHLSDRDLCWDLCHEVFVRLLLAQAAGMSLGKPRRWLMRVATNLLVDTYRQRAASRAQVVPLSEDLSVKLVDAKAFWSLIEREDLLERLTRTFRALPRKARLLLYWREFERLSVQEMAMQLKTTEAVVSTELWRARTQFQQTYLREHFQGLLHPDEEIFEHLVRLVPFDLVTPPDEQLDASWRNGGKEDHLPQLPAAWSSHRGVCVWNDGEGLSKRDALGSLSLLSARGGVNPGSECSIVLEKRSLPCFFQISCSLRPLSSSLL